MATRQAIKAVKTNEKFAGNQYGRIYKHSRVDRYYSVEVEGKIICEDWFLSLNGARLAAELVKLGLSESDLNSINCDDLGHVKYLHASHPEVAGMDPAGRLQFVAKGIVAKRSAK